MEKVLKSIFLKHHKSTFIVDLVQHQNQKMYLAIEQTIATTNGISSPQKIKINPDVLDELVEILTNLKNEIAFYQVESHFSDQKTQELIRRYLIGVEIKDLALQFNCPETAIEQILINNGLEIMSNKMPKPTKRYWRRKR